jgi:iron complex transport system substrate-binding protein
MISALLLAAASVAAQHLGPPVPPEVRRIVTLAPSLSELVLALGAGDRLVGVTRFDDDPRTASLPRVGGFNDPEPETVLSLRPDLVLVETAPENRGPVEALARLGIPVEAFPLGNVAQVEDAMRAAGKMLGVAPRGAELARELETRRAQARAGAAAGSHPRALLVFDLEPLVVATAASFAGELLADVGAINAAANASRPYSRLSVEAAVAAAPDVIVLAGVAPAQGRPAIRGLERARVVQLRSTALLHPGPRLVDAIGDLEAALRPATGLDGGADGRIPTGGATGHAPAGASSPARSERTTRDSAAIPRASSETGGSRD